MGSFGTAATFTKYSNQSIDVDTIWRCSGSKPWENSASSDFIQPLFLHRLATVNFVNIDNWSVFRYELPLHKPIAARGANRLIRKGLLIFMRNTWGIGIGEAAPIEGFHPISYDQTQEDIRMRKEREASMSQ